MKYRLYKSFSNEEKLEIVRLYVEEKLSSNKIADAYCANSATITMILEVSGVDRCKYNLLNKDIVKTMFDSGLKLSEIGRKMGVSPGVIKRCLSANFGTVFENAREKTKRLSMAENLNRISDLYISGESYAKIGKKFNVSGQTIKTVIKLNGITRIAREVPYKPRYNANSIQFFKFYDLANNTKGLYGENEIRIGPFFVDYFNDNLKVIIEFDEKHHQYFREQDTTREKQIKELYPSYKFIRINEEDLI
jgi:hypothetical protein